MAATDDWRWLRTAFALAVAASSVTAVVSACFLRKKSKYLDSRVRELESSLKAYVDKWASERQGRIRAQQALRKALMQDKSDDLKGTSYPLASIAVVQSCFSTRNGTPRQPLLVPLARARLVFDSSRVPLAALEGLSEYSHCWILYVFHLNTDLEKLWRDPSRSKFKAKVRVPRLRGGKKGIFATRSPHRPCPIGLTVAKVEAVQGHMVLLSGVDLADGTPVLDIKPYLPYCDSIEGAKVPEWVKEDGLLSVATVKFSRDFFSTLADCWVAVEKKSLYASSEELENLIKQVLSWDIRSLSQRDRPHESSPKSESHLRGDPTSDLEDDDDEKDVIYHLLLEGLDISYRIDTDANVVVGKVSVGSYINSNQKRRSNMT